MTDPSTSSDGFLVEVMVNGAPQYMLVGPLDGPRPIEDIPGVNSEQIEGLFGGGLLRAAALPSSGDGMSGEAEAAQSMDRIRLG